MKKLTKRYRKWLLYRQASQSKFHNRTKTKKSRVGGDCGTSHIVKCLTPEGLVDAIALRKSSPPSRLCFEDNSEPTFSFLERWCKKLSNVANEKRNREYWLRAPRTKRGLSRIASYVDFSELEYVSTAAALVMTAEFDRAAIKSQMV